MGARRLVLTGRVQGVGFRPFVYRLARELDLRGWVRNDAGKVIIHVEGHVAVLDRFERRLIRQAPPLARPQLGQSDPAPAGDHEAFSIHASDALSKPEIHVPPDMFTCDDCLDELTHPRERRFGYPFINCTQCGPRYTLIRAMPYDRPNTSMADFPLCPDCEREYLDPADRRFHAQPLACARCGPTLEFVDGGTMRRVTGVERAMPLAIEALRKGDIVAAKGVGGYHLVCDAANTESVKRLRERKRRPHKPLAVMFPFAGEDGLELIRQHTRPGKAEQVAIVDPARPIVLVPRRDDSSLSPALADGLAELGVFLPYSPLHHELLSAYGAPLVATSGNISGEPVLTTKQAAEQRLSAICDHFLHHDRPIVRPADDPVVRAINGKIRTIRIGRGMAPLEFALPKGTGLEPTIATGGHMKNTVALGWDDRLVVSPHIGELDSLRSFDIFKQVINDLQDLYNVDCKMIACDAHPGYASSRWAHEHSSTPVLIQHHHAHASSLAGEHPDIERWLVFAWDGVGMGDDGTLWGGEALAGAPGRWQRAASFRPFGLVGGDKAGREPWRSAAALVWTQAPHWRPPVAGSELAAQAWQRGLTVHQSSAAGRLFDAAAALVLGHNQSSYEGQGPMQLEAITSGIHQPVDLPLILDDTGLPRSDWAPLLPVLSDETLEPAKRAGIFHESMAAALVKQALRVRETTGFDAVGLSGGVFQNRYLSERVITLLANHDIKTRLHRRIPANDGGLAFGQLIETAARQKQENS